MKLSGSVALVTGGASGLGAATVRRLAAGGAKVVIVDRDEARGGALAAELGQTYAKADVTDPAQIEAAIAQASSLGPLRVVVSCAGVGWASRTLDKTGKPHELDLFKTVIGINLIGTFNVIRLAAEKMSTATPNDQGERGVIVNTASIGAVAPRPGVTVYNATKGAVVTMTRGLAVELARFNIRVNAVNPVAADTPFMRGALGGDSLPDANRAALIAGIPLRRLTEPTDVAAAVTFLASDDAAFLTGVCLPVDGGRSIS